MVPQLYGTSPRLVIYTALWLCTLVVYNSQPQVYIRITSEPWVNHFVAKETPVRFQNCFVSWGWQLQWRQMIGRRLYVSVFWLLPKPKTLSMACFLDPYSLADVCCCNEQLHVLLSLFKSMCQFVPLARVLGHRFMWSGESMLFLTLHTVTCTLSKISLHRTWCCTFLACSRW